MPWGFRFSRGPVKKLYQGFSIQSNWIFFVLGCLITGLGKWFRIVQRRNCVDKEKLWPTFFLGPFSGKVCPPSFLSNLRNCIFLLRRGPISQKGARVYCNYLGGGSYRKENMGEELRVHYHYWWKFKKGFCRADWRGKSENDFGGKTREGFDSLKGREGGRYRIFYVLLRGGGSSFLLGKKDFFVGPIAGALIGAT